MAGFRRRYGELSTTQICTQLSIWMLKEVHTPAHPAATISPQARAELESELADEEAELADETSDASWNP